LSKRKKGRIIIFRQGQFGDTLVAFPVIEALHRLYMETPLVYCTNHFKSNKYVQGRDVALLNPHIHEIITYCVEDSFIKKWRGLKEDLKVSKNDILIYLPYSRHHRYQVVRDWFFFKTLGFRKMLGFKETWWWDGYWFNTPELLPKESKRMLDVLRSAGIQVDFPNRCALRFDHDWADRQWQEWGIKDNSVLAICPGSKMQSKRWPVERYIEVGREWHVRKGAMLVIVGGPEEAQQANEVVKSLPGYSFSSCGATLSQTAAILSRVQAYCGNDTGSMHLASVLGIPIVALFSARDRAKLWYPMGDRNVVLSAEVSCANCQLVRCHTSTPICLDLISVGQVLDAIEKVWNTQIKN
jgi:heptosyltransferase-3